MLLTNRLFKRESPKKDSKKIFIFCEGAKREYEYFQYFEGIDSRINICTYKLNPHEDNSPTGLLCIAKKCLLAETKKPGSIYEFRKNDEVWIIFDADPDKLNSRLPQAIASIEGCKKKDGWFTCISNPCFEVWLYYHFSSVKLERKKIDKPSTWKAALNDYGGFDSRKHPIFIERAKVNASDNFEAENGLPKIGCTEVFKLSESMLPLLKEKLRSVLTQIDTE